MATETTVIIPPDDPLPPLPDRSLIATDKIAADLMSAILANSTLAANYTVARYGSTLHITKNTGDFVPYVADTLENTGLSVLKDTVQGADQLPAHAPPNFMLQVVGDPSTAVDDYWMIFKDGKWQESADPGMLRLLDKQTMPWVLSSTGTGGSRAFSFGPVDWTPRDAGNDTNNAVPPIDGIDTLFVTEGRLGITSGSNVILSASNAPKTLFRSTVAQLLPSDPVSVRSTLGNVGRYKTALAWDGAVQLWSDQAQREVYGDPAITPSTIVIAPTSAFDSDTACQPIVVGSRVYFTRYVNGSIRVFEYSRPPGYDSLPEATDLTESVPTYLTGRAKQIAADEALGFLAVIPQGSGSTVYVCHLQQGQNGPVPTWHRWTFAGASVLAGLMVNEQLALLVLRGGSLAIEYIDVATPAETSLGAVVDAAGSPVVPSVRVDHVYLQTQGGPDATSRITVRNLTVFHRDTRAASLRLLDETDDRVTVTSLQPNTPLRVPLMRTLETLGFTLSWTGFLTNIELQGTQVSRSRRV